jgi:SMC interacting uncharacterized protein involved in chromosome segregation
MTSYNSTDLNSDSEDLTDTSEDDALLQEFSYLNLARKKAFTTDSSVSMWTKDFDVRDMIIKEKDNEIAYLRRQLALSEQHREKLRCACDNTKGKLGHRHNDCRRLVENIEKKEKRCMELSTDNDKLKASNEAKQYHISNITTDCIFKYGWCADPNKISVGINTSWLYKLLPPE